MARALGLIAAVALVACGGGGGEDAPPAGPGGSPMRFAYVANANDATVSILVASSETGEVRHAGYARTGAGPAATVLSPDGRFLFVPNSGAASVSVFTADAQTGALAPVDSSKAPGLQAFVAPAGATPSAAAVTPDGQFLYVANSGSATVSAYHVTPIGTLEPVDANTTTVAHEDFATGAGPGAIAVHPSGRFLHVACRSANAIAAYAIDPQAGRLTELDRDPGTGGVQRWDVHTDPRSLVLDPAGKHLYAAAFGTDQIWGWAVDAATGALTSLGTPQAMTSGAGPEGIAVHPTGRYVFSADSGR